MKLFMIIYFTGKIAGWVGPLPYDFEECKEHATAIIEELKTDVITPQGHTHKDVAITCEFSETTPSIEFGMEQWEK
jgi:hypothetical protein